MRWRTTAAPLPAFFQRVARRRSGRAVLLALVGGSATLSLLFGASWFVSAVSCHQILSIPQTPRGYAPPLSWFSGGFLITADCTDTTATITVGDGNPLTWVYDTAYFWDGARWNTLGLAGSSKNGRWIPRRATATFTLPQPAAYVAAYTCEWQSGAWRCGCVDAGCTQSAWELQQIKNDFPLNVRNGGEAQGEGVWRGTARLIAPRTGAEGTLRNPTSAAAQCRSAPTYQFLSKRPIAETRPRLTAVTPCSQRYEPFFSVDLRESDIGRPVVEVLNERYGGGLSAKGSHRMYGSGTTPQQQRNSFTVERGPGGKIAMQRNIVPGIVPASSFAFNNFPQGARAACLSLEVFIPQGFKGNKKQSHKLGYGFWGGARPTGGGTSPLRQLSDDQGFVVRNTWNEKTTALYSYHLNRGESGRWSVINEPKCDAQACCLFGDSSAPGEITRGRWVRIEEEVVVNSAPDRYDGYSRLWIDGRLVGEITGQWFDDMRLRGLYINDMWGGSFTKEEYQATASGNYWFANYRVYR